MWRGHHIMGSDLSNGRCTFQEFPTSHVLERVRARVPPAWIPDGLNDYCNNMKKPIASLSLDLDDLWAYQRSHGDPEWTNRKSYLPVLMTPLLDLLDECSCR